MFRLSKKTDYALLALQYLAGEGAAGAASARSIAERFNIPLELLAKILQQLVRRGVIAAHKGAHGGYVLSRPAHAISIVDVMEAVEGPITFTACSPTDERCGQFPVCTVRDPLWRIRERIVAVLRTMTLADINEHEDRRDAALTIQRGPPHLEVHQR
jgi:Rrf2 family protein